MHSQPYSLACDCVLRQSGTGAVAIPLKPYLQERERPLKTPKAARRFGRERGALDGLWRNSRLIARGL